MKKITTCLFLFICVFLLSFAIGCDKDNPVDDDVQISFVNDDLLLNNETEIELNTKNVDFTKVNFEFSDESVVKVENNKFIPLEAGECEVTITYENLTDKIMIYVLPKIKERLSLNEEIICHEQFNYQSNLSDILKIENGTLIACGSGKATITISAKSNPEIKESYLISVMPKIAYEGTTIKLNDDVYIGFIDGNNDDYNWKLSDESIGFLFEDYYLSALDLGTLVVTVTSKTDPNEKYEYTFEIVPGNPTFSLSSDIIIVGDKVDVNVASIDEMKITSSNETIMKYENGQLTALSEGVVTITVAYKEYPASSKSVEVTVYKKEPIINIAREEITLGNALRLNIVNYQEGYEVAIDDPTIIEYKDGYLNSLKQGSTIVKVSLTSDPSVYSEVLIKVLPVMPEISFTYPVIEVGAETGFFITNFDKLEYTNYSEYTVQSSDTKVASIITNNGKTLIKGIGAGNCEIIITAKNNTASKTAVSLKVVASNDKNTLYATVPGVTSVLENGSMIAVSISNFTSLEDYLIISSDESKLTVTDSGKVVATGKGIVSVSVILKDNRDVKFTMTFSIEGDPNINYIERIMNIAEEQIGYKEGSNNDTKYGDWYGMPNEPWCAMFVSWCANQSGISTSIIPKYASVSLGMQWFQNNNRFGVKGEYTPKPGDIIFFKSSGASHTGLVINCIGDIVYTIEGNTSNMVAKRMYSLDWKTITGYGIPNYPAYDGVVVGGSIEGATNGGGASTT